MAYDNVDEAYLIELVPTLSDTMKLPPKMARYESEKFQPGFFFFWSSLFSLMLAVAKVWNPPISSHFVYCPVGLLVQKDNSEYYYLTISGSYILKHQQNICH